MKTFIYTQWSHRGSCHIGSMAHEKYQIWGHMAEDKNEGRGLVEWIKP
jgi:hypothetical protein